MMIDIVFEFDLSYTMNIILSFIRQWYLLLVWETITMMDIGLFVYSSFVSDACYQVDSFFFSVGCFFFFLVVVVLAVAENRRDCKKTRER
jgi:hypothetical protein